MTSTLHQETGKGWVNGRQTKTKRDRVIELRPDTVEVLRLHKIRQAEAKLKAGSFWEDRGLVFTTDVGKPLDQRFIQRTLDKACERAGIPRRTIKELRHTYATLALIEDVRVKIVSEALGHATTNITQEIYLHVVGVCSATGWAIWTESRRNCSRFAAKEQKRRDDGHP